MEMGIWRRRLGDLTGKAGREMSYEQEDGGHVDYEKTRIGFIWRVVTNRNSVDTIVDRVRRSATTATAGESDQESDHFVNVCRTG